MCKPKVFGGLGFRDLDLFNTAPLAKQGWKLITQSDSSIAHLLKLKYYPRNNFYGTMLGCPYQEEKDF